MNFYIRSLSLGCKLNQIESESIAAKFTTAGFKIAKPGEGIPDGKVVLSIINTCTVTGKAEQKARHSIRDLLRQDPDSLVLVTGCYAQLEAEYLCNMDNRILVVQGEKKGNLSELPGFLTLETGGKLVYDDMENPCKYKSEFARIQSKIGEFPYLFKPGKNKASPETVIRETFPAPDTAPPRKIRKNPPPKGKILLNSFKNDETAFNLSTDELLFHSRASIKIQDGCNYRCSYCRICYARGSSVSLNHNEVINRIQNLENKGWEEVVLTGVNLSLYKSGNLDFTGLLNLIIQNTKKIMIRISSLYPNYVDEAFLRVVSSPRIAPHFHLSIQSGSERILKLMRRPHSAEEIFLAVENLRKVKDNPFLACDIITGFPGETEEDFSETLEMCRKIKFSWIHGFPFSPRPGTEAWYMEPRIPQRTAGERLKILTKLALSDRKDYISCCLNKTYSGIVETARKTGSCILTDNYLHCLVSGTQELKTGTRVSVRLKENLLDTKPSGNFSLGDFDCSGDIEFFP